MSKSEYAIRHGRYRPKRLAMILTLLIPLVAGTAFASTPGSRLQRLEARAARAHLAATDEWHALLHYEPNWMHGGVHSEVASAWFFLAKDGQTDPAAELDATLAGLFSKQPIGPRKLPAYCLFVARRKFLVRKLDIDTSTLPVHDCPGYRHWRAVIAPDAASLVFPTAFPNSPSSMFGHTLLRIDSARRRHGTELLSYAVNFAAAAPQGNRGLGFVWKGLTGGYPGVFGLFPYYKKVKQYAWIENRDVWSYPLNLTQAQLSRLVDHVWEMDSVHFVYYFLNKNCSYQLLSLLDVARPHLHLTRQYNWYAIPSDTIRSLADVPGLMGPAEYRPSMETTLRWETRQLSPAEQTLARKVSRHELAPDAPALNALPAKRRAAVLEVAYDALNYQLSSKEVKAAVPGQAGRDYANHILAVRASIPRRSPFGRVPTPKTSPEDGHRSLRVNVSGVYADDDFSLGFRIRPAYHDLLDNPGGYTRGAAIDFADIGLRLDPSDGRLRLDNVHLLSITSLSPRNAWFKPVSFTADTGIRRRPSAHVFTNAPNDLGYYLQGGPGLAWGGRDLMVYTFGLGSFDANPGLQPAWALGAGGSAGMLAYPVPGVQLKAEAGWLQYAAGADGHYGWAKFGAQVPLVDNFAFRSTVGYENTRVDDGLRVDFGIQAYF
ncbi:Lnb N-terminal periplasmic domain-containing protein [Salinisphaera hydrothermalis]|uniref:Lnb N-terminal periplasmic domain-containing protein n=1 Tax=Salinisphaera hydrothermalis TaxID=563188 RepID=UPI00334037FF